jgi:hypothetical protein
MRIFCLDVLAGLSGAVGYPFAAREGVYRKFLSRACLAGTLAALPFGLWFEQRVPNRVADEWQTFRLVGAFAIWQAVMGLFLLVGCRGRDGERYISKS